MEFDRIKSEVKILPAFFLCDLRKIDPNFINDNYWIGSKENISCVWLMSRSLFRSNHIESSSLDFCISTL